MSKYSLFLLVFLMGFTSMAQLATVTGKVIDEDGTPMQGVNILVKGSQNGAMTDFDGNYSIKNVKRGDVLVFSYLGFRNKEEKVGKSFIINVKMVSEAQQLEDVVLVGHGEQKKVTVSGAITSISAEELRMSSSSSLTTAFAGQLAGVIAKATNGAPGAVSNFYIRGISTFGGVATPLILLDDVEISVGDLNNIPPETIEGFSILKDASATAIYGSQGANGVMVIRTKSGKKNQKTRIGVTFEQSMNYFVNFPDFVDGATWMEMYNEALTSRNAAATPRYSQETIDATRQGVNPYVYPDVDWKRVLLKDYALNQRANINITGGGQKATYYMSIQANHDTGLLKTKKVYSWDNNIDRWAYNFQNNISYDILEGTRIDLKMNAQVRFTTSPNQNVGDILGRIRSNNPINFPVIFPEQEGDRHIRFGSSVITGNTYRQNPYAEMLRTFKEDRGNAINTSLKLTQNLDFVTKGLKGTFLANFKNWSSNSFHRTIEPYIYRVKPDSYNSETQEYELERLGSGGTDYISQSAITKGGNQNFVIQTSLTYDRSFKDHSFGGLLMYYQKEHKNEVLPQRNQALSARATYNYKNRYFIEGNFGYTGTERLKKGTRFQFFPAVSAGWVVSDESFFKPISNVVSFMKLRASYGLVGNDRTGTDAGHFLYINDVTFDPRDNNQEGNRYKFTTGETLGNTKKGPKVLKWAVDNARWEKAAKFNIGTDLKLFRELSITTDYFFERRSDILLQRKSWPDMMGYGKAIPWANLGVVHNWGYELSTNWNHKFNEDWSLALRGNLTYTQNKYVNRDHPAYTYPWLADTGFPISYSFGYIAEGLFSSQEEIDNSPLQNLGSIPLPGDIKYRDITGDGIIDSSDRTMLSEYGGDPRLQYGFGFNLTYKKFDFNVQFVGSGYKKRFLGLNGILGQNDNNIFQYIADDYWSVNNPNPNASYPRLGLQEEHTANNKHTSSYWLRDASFLRFKTLDIGYKFKQGRVYVTGDNLAIFTDFKYWDPELDWNAYPLQRTFSLGVQLHF